MSDREHDELPRALRLHDAVGIGFGAIIGAGIFVVTGVAAGLAGPSLLLALLIAAVAAAANALSSAQLAASYPRSGATYEYGYELLHPLAGFTAGWMFLASKIAAAGTVALGLAGYLAPLAGDVPPRVFGVAAIVLFTALNVAGVRRTSRVNLAIVAVSVGALLLFIVTGAPRIQAENFRPFAPGGYRGVLEAGAVLFFAYTGYARIASLGGEVRDPARTIPRAIVVTIAGAVLLYVAVSAVAVGAAGAAAIADTAAPLRIAAEGAGSWVTASVTVGGVAAMLGVMLSQILGLSRMAYAMARRGDLPAQLARVHVGSGVPRPAVLAVGVTAAVVAAMGTLGDVARAASFTILVYYGIANLAALRLRGAQRLYPAWIPVLGLVSCTGLALSLEGRIIVVGLTVLAAGLLLRGLWRGASRR